ncbi:hypothetical protein [Aliiglaciecola sp. LCG003]|nr:hypothetical protein [Aliiglaciecola sp. LCG003]WJG10633.1 hypothetical protein QR722_06215 [Aliiglaciecola sp. LCG003]
MLKAYAVALMLTTSPASTTLDGAKQAEQKTVTTQTTQAQRPGNGIGF